MERLEQARKRLSKQPKPPTPKSSYSISRKAMTQRSASEESLSLLGRDNASQSLARYSKIPKYSYSTRQHRTSTRSQKRSFEKPCDESRAKEPRLSSRTDFLRSEERRV